MTMTPGDNSIKIDDLPEDISAAIWWVLQRIKKEYLATALGEQVYFSIVPGEVVIIGKPKTVPEQEDQQRGLRILEKAGAIKIGQYGYSSKMTGKYSYTGSPILKGAYLNVLQPEFDTTYEQYRRLSTPPLTEDKTQTINQKNFEPEIDRWLSNKDESVIQKIRRVVLVLDHTWQLKNQDEFEIPHGRLDKAGISDSQDLEDILASLHREKFIFVSRKVAEQPPSDDPANKPGGMSLWQPIDEDPKMIYDNKNTKIEILPQKFKQLVQTLEEFVTQEQHKEEPKEPSQASEGKTLECRSLKVDLDQSTIRYNDNPPLEVSAGVNIIKFLILLMENKRVVEYTEIAQKLGLNCYHDGVTNKDVAREVQFLRRDLGDFLVKTGMNKTEIQEMFISKKNIGYKLRYSN